MNSRVNSANTDEMKALVCSVSERVKQYASEGKTYTVHQLLNDCIEVVEENNFPPTDASALLFCMVDITGGYFQSLISWRASYDAPGADRIEKYFNGEFG